MKHLTWPATDGEHIWGALDAQIVIVEYGDYDCPHTRAAGALLHHLMAERPGQVALVFRHFPLRHIHQNAEALSRLMKAVTDPEQYRRAHDALLAIRRMSLPAAEQALVALGHDLAQLRQMDSSVAPLVQRDVEHGLADGVHSTPSFFFNGAPWDGHYDLATLRERLAAAPAREA